MKAFTSDTSLTVRGFVAVILTLAASSRSCCAVVRRYLQLALCLGALVASQSGCATLPPSPEAISEYTPGPETPDAARWRHAYDALRHELHGRFKDAIDAWLRAPATRWTGVRLAALALEHRFHLQQIARLGGGGVAWAEARAIAASEAGLRSAYNDALAAMGVIGPYERCGDRVVENEVLRLPEDGDGWPIGPEPGPCHAAPASDGWLVPSEDGAGLQRYRFESQQQQGGACIEIVGGLPWRLREGSTILAIQRSDRRLLPSRRRFLVTGAQTLTLDVLHDATDTALRVALLPDAECGRDVLPPGPAATLALADLARHDGHMEGAFHIGTERVSPDPLVRVGMAAAHLADHTISEGLRVEQALAALGPADPADPWSIAALRARFWLETGRVDEVRELSDIVSDFAESSAFESATPGRPGSYHWDLLRMQLADLEEDRPKTLALARRLLADGNDAPCAVRKRALETAAPWLLPHELDVRTVLGGSIPVRGPCANLHRVTADTLAQLGRLDDAADVLDGLIAADQASWPPVLQRDICLLQQRIAQRRDGTRNGPSTRTTTSAIPCQQAATTPADSGPWPSRPADMRRFLLTASDTHGRPVADTSTITALLRKTLERPLSDYFEVVLNERIDAPLPDGRLISRHHRVACFHDPDATTRLGEVPVSPSATPIIARTWKVHRGTGSLHFQPIDFDDGDSAPDTISLPALEPGDCAEILWFDDHAPVRGIAPGLLAPTFHFDDDQGPTHLARWAILTRHLSAPLVAAPTSPRPGTGLFRRHDRDSGPGFEVGPAPAAIPEPLDPRPDLRRVSVRPAAGFSEQQWLQTMARDLSHALRPPPRPPVGLPDATAMTTDLTAVLVKSVFEHIEDTEEPPGNTSLSETFASGRGSRALALVGAARAIGVPAALLLARPLSDGGPGAPDDEPEAFAWPLVLLGHENTRVVDPRSPDTVPPPTLRGVDAHVVAGDGLIWRAGTRVRTPDVSPGERNVRLTIAVDPERAALSGTGAERLTGTFAQAWRGVIQRIPADNRGRLMTHVAEPSFPRLTTTNHVLDGIAHADPALLWRFEFQGPMTRISPDRVELHLRLVPDDPLNASGRLSQRRNPMFFNMIARMHLTAAISVPTDWHPVNLPADIGIEAAGFSYQRTFRWDADTRVLRIEKRWGTDPRWVDVADFPAFRALAARISQSDDVRLDLVHSRLLPSEGGTPGPFSWPPR